MFFRPNFVTISLDNSYVKNQFLGLGEVKKTPLWALFSCFSSFFFSRFFVFFLAFYFSFFLIFCSFLNFLIFNVFIFSEEKVSSFLFSSISFKYVLLLASVSEFHCFLCSRCPMEMWCPDDIGRDSLDWVGPRAWERA